MATLRVLALGAWLALAGCAGVDEGVVPPPLGDGALGDGAIAADSSSDGQIDSAPLEIADPGDSTPLELAEPDPLRKATAKEKQRCKLACTDCGADAAPCEDACLDAMWQHIEQFLACCEATGSWISEGGTSAYSDYCASFVDGSPVPPPQGSSACLWDADCPPAQRCRLWGEVPTCGGWPGDSCRDDGDCADGLLCADGVGAKACYSAH